MQQLILKIQDALSYEPLSISEIAKRLDINWRTAEHYLNVLRQLGLVEEIETKHTRAFYKKAKDNYFDLPIKKEDNKKISTIFYYIKKYCMELFDKEPTKTQAYKTLWHIDQRLNLKLPIGWYRYGPCCVQVYKGDESAEITLSSETKNIIKEITKTDCAVDKLALQKRVYSEENMQLYLTKEELRKGIDDKEQLNLSLMDLIKYSPEETVEVVTDFARAALLIGWKKVSQCFEFVWKYIAMVVFKKSLEFYFHENINRYLDSQIDAAKKEAQTHIHDLVKTQLK